MPRKIFKHRFSNKKSQLSMPTRPTLQAADHTISYTLQAGSIVLPAGQ
jgi:hypothetical protein